ncbi:sugar ABC transporter substrate-binding protein [Domibacillus sp. A3M-37]|uniref:ABC transporter substrate-binding protein n=1 Tax=Domibacillus sp. A3M-37 TaxID=2962037 RepID=UPI0020B80273|nr:sugar ABC transporter substrate-binding protein [Domibacillus sp. A3M-37]MCP3763466.1 sugar ABC transporter substrate-binding protein [Domibacillus sp. A3M-37]
MKRKTKRFFGFIAFLMISSLIIAGCSNGDTSTGSDSSKGNGGSGEKVNITMSAWGNPAELKVYQRALDSYMKKNPNVSIKLVPIPSDAYEQKLMTQLQGGSGPDVFYVGDATMAKLATNGSVAELSEFMNTEESFAKPDEYAEGLWGAAKQGDKIYGVTVDSNPLVMYYNKTVLEEAGVKSPQEYYDENKWNWEAFDEVTKQLKDAGKEGFIAERWLMDTWIWSNGGLAYDDEGNYVLDKNAKAKEALQYLDELKNKDQILYAGSLPKGQGLDAMFMSNKVGFVAAGNWLVPMFSQNPSLKFDFVPFPTNTGNKREPVQVPTAYMSVSAKSDVAEEAMKFATYYVSKEGQEVRLKGSGNAVPSIKGIDDVVVEGSPVEHIQYLIDGRDTGFANGSPRMFKGQIPGLNIEWEEQFDLMFLGKQDVDKTIQKITEITKQKTEEYKANQ